MAPSTRNSTEQSLRSSSHHTSPRPQRIALAAALVAGLGGAALAPSDASAQTRTATTPRRNRLRPVYIIPVNSAAGRALEGTVPPSTSEVTTPTTEGQVLDLSSTLPTTIPPTPATVLRAAQEALPTPSTTPEATVPTTSERPSSDLATPVPGYDADNSGTSSSSSRSRSWYGGVGLTTMLVPGLFRDPPAPTNNISVSAGRCTPELSAAGNASGRYICSLTFSGGNNQYTIDTTNGAEITTAPGTGRNATVAIPATSLSTIQVTSNGVSRTFNVTTRADGGNTRTFSSQQVGETNAPGSPTRVTVIPAIEAYAGRNFNNWDLRGSVRLGVGITLSRPDLYYIGARVGVGYHGPRRSVLRAGVQTGFDAFIPDSSDTSRVAIPLEATGTIFTSSNPRSTCGFVSATLGASIPTDDAPVNFMGTVSAGIHVR